MLTKFFKNGNSILLAFEKILMEEYEMGKNISNTVSLKDITESLKEGDELLESIKRIRDKEDSDEGPILERISSPDVNSKFVLIVSTGV